jgi:imidazolonepropionase-like amidohydrolase
MTFRKSGFFLCAAALAIALGSSSGQTRAALVIVHANVVDVRDGRILPNATIAITGNVVTAVTPNGNVPREARQFDAQGKYVIPGLWDMHAHTQATGESSLQLAVANGVTGIRDMGSDLDLILKLREETASGRTLGPRIFAAGPILDDAPGDWPFRLRVKTADDGRSAVQLLKRRGVDLIKVHDHTPRAAYFAIAEESRRLNLPLAGHVPIGITVDEAIDAGQGSIEHLSNGQVWRSCSGGGTYRPDACRPYFEMLARRGIWQTPTIAAGLELATIGTSASSISADQFGYAEKGLREMWAENQKNLPSPAAVRQFRATAETGATVTADMSKTGVPILAGCDGMISGFCIHDELAVMVRGGMTTLAALQTATLNPARYFNMQAAAGTIEAGKRADLLLLDANPLADIKNVSRIHAVVLAGRVLDRVELDRVLAAVKAKAAR